MAITRNSALFAVRNVAKFGDTDVYPFPLENHWFYDSAEEVADLLLKLDRNFEEWLRDYPVRYSTELSRVGYNGFRAATQIDPIWNAYLLALLIEIGEDLERSRVPVESGTVFSYRYKPSGQDLTLFNRDVGWHLFQTHVQGLSFERVWNRSARKLRD